MFVESKGLSGIFGTRRDAHLFDFDDEFGSSQQVNMVSL